MRRITSLLFLAPVLVLAGQGCALDLCTDFPGACGPAGQGGSGGATSSSSGTSGGGMGGAAGGGGEGGGVIIPTECDPREAGPGATIPETCGVFIDTGRATGPWSGTKAAPFNDFAVINNPQLASVQLFYVCATNGAPIDEQLVIERSAVIFGGFVDCSGWTVPATAAPERTEWTAPAGEVPLKVVGNTNDLTLWGFAITARDAVGTDANGQGRSSIAAWVDAAKFTAERSELRAGNGAQGAAGAAPAGAVSAAPNGMPGENGCVDTNNKDGGDGGQNSCEDTDGNTVDVSGGLGGAGTKVAAGGNGGPGEPDPGGGTSGKRQDGTACTAGGQGNPGGSGAAAATPTATVPGTLDATGYQGPAAVDGKRGNPGTGGGGGGGARQCASNATFAGPGGGGGGAGGCGGVGGKGGSPGGASIALLATQNATVTLNEVLLAASEGGQGGQGALGQPGQQGGFGLAPNLGGNPGTNNSDAGAFACTGGGGANGGLGGPGAGGAGGAAALIARGTGATVTRTGSTASDVTGTPGAAGPAAAGGNPGILGLACGTLLGTTWACE